MIAKGKLRPRQMNRMESAYGLELELRKRVGEILWWEFQCWKLRLADDTQYTPDFAVMLANGEMEIHETKGFLRDDAAVKLKVAAQMYPFRFYLVEKSGQSFKLTEV